jgi:hypothetical protein
MLAIDANVVVRYLADDHPIQSARARALIERKNVFVRRPKVRSRREPDRGEQPEFRRGLITVIAPGRSGHPS